MIKIWVDDIRPSPGTDDDIWCGMKTVNETVKFIRRRYKE